VSDAIKQDVQTQTGARFACRQCGARLEFAPGTTSLNCPYCGAGNEFGSAQDQVIEQDFHAQLAALADHAQTEDRRVITCDACNAQFEPAPTITATDCPFCGFHLNLTQRIARLIKPRAVLPFQIERAQAQQAFFGWLSGLWFAPGKLKRYARTESKLSGMYVPYWTYDSNTTSKYVGQRGDDYYVTVGSGKDARRERRTRWTSVSGVVKVPFDDVLVLASTSLPAKLAHELEPWDLNKLVNYADEFLTGFQSECYHVDLEQGFEVAKQIMNERIADAIRADIGGDHQRISSVDTRHDSITFKHILLPVWVSAYRFQNRIFRFLVNARTGEVHGERPYSAVKIVLAVLAGLIVLGAILFFIAQR
jgi:predicted RNA-binding Zn-ribbon protein involved in translation (DUF1610 family)